MSDLAVSVDALWVLVAASFVFLMQAGFLAFEVGCVRPKSATSVAMKNIIDWVMITLVFFLFGFGLMFGHSEGGWIGTDLFALVGLDATDGMPLKSIFFIFQLAFAATAATIVSGAMSERTGFVAYLCISAVHRNGYLPCPRTLGGGESLLRVQRAVAGCDRVP